MALVRSSLVVPAPVESVFDFVAYPKNFTRMWPAMTAIYGEKPSPHGGLDWLWQYHMIGMKLEGQTHVLSYDRPAHIQMISEGGGLGVAHSWWFAPTDMGTRLDLAMDFRLPARWLTGFMEPLLNRENKQQAAIAMTNLLQAFT